MARTLVLRAIAAAALCAASASQAITLQTLVASGGTLEAGGLVFSDFLIEPVPLTSPQGALVNDGADIDISTVVIDGRAGLHLLQVDPVTLQPSPLAVDLLGNGEKNFLRNVHYTVTVANPGVLLHSVVEALGPATGALKEVSGFVGTYIGAAHVPAVGTLNNVAQIVDPALAASFVVNPTGLPGGDTAALDADTAWTLTTAHGRGATPVGSGRIDYIDITWDLTPTVPEPSQPALWTLGLAALGVRRLRRD